MGVGVDVEVLRADEVVDLLDVEVVRELGGRQFSTIDGQCKLHATYLGRKNLRAAVTLNGWVCATKPVDIFKSFCTTAMKGPYSTCQIFRGVYDNRAY